MCKVSFVLYLLCIAFVLLGFVMSSVCLSNVGYGTHCQHIYTIDKGKVRKKEEGLGKYLERGRE